MQGWIIAWRYAGVWLPQRLCAEVYNPLRRTAGSWRRADVDITGGGSEVEMTAELFLEVGRALNTQDPRGDPTRTPVCSQTFRKTAGTRRRGGDPRPTISRRPRFWLVGSGKASPVSGGASRTCSEFLVLSGSRCPGVSFRDTSKFEGILPPVDLVIPMTKAGAEQTGQKKKPTAASGPLFQLQLQQKENRFSRSFFIFMGLKRSGSDSRRRSKRQQSVFPFGPNPGKSVRRRLKGRRGGNIKQSR